MALRDRITKWLFHGQYVGGRMVDSSMYTRAGVTVSADSAMRLATVNACVRVLSEDVATLPEMLYRRTGTDGRERATDHPLYDIIHRAPNSEMTAFTFKQTLMVNVLLTGNAYAFIEFNGRGNVMGIWPLPSSKVEPFRDIDGNVKYRYNGSEVFDSREVLHIPGMGFDGIKGLSPIRYAADTIGFAAAAEEYGEKFFSNGTHLGGVLQTEGALSDEAYKRLQTDFSEMYRGLQRSHGVPILESGTKFVEMGINQKDAQFLETRKYQRTEIAALFRVPPHMIGDLEKATFSNIEHQSIEYLQRGLVPWLERIEQEEERKLLKQEERKDYYLEHVTSNFLRGDAASRMQAYSTAIMSGIMTPNEARQRENLNPVEGGDEILLPLNMAQGGEPIVDETQRTFREAYEERAARRRRAGYVTDDIIAELRDALSDWNGKQAEDIQVLLELEQGEELLGDMEEYFIELKEKGLPEELTRAVDKAVRATREAMKKQVQKDKVDAIDDDWIEGFDDIYHDEMRDRLVSANENEVKRKLGDGSAEKAALCAAALAKWSKARSTRMAKNEANSIAAEAMTAAARKMGVKAYWSATTMECKACRDLNGQKVTTLKPPLHTGCNCQIVLKDA